MNWAIKIIIGLLIINLLYTYYLRREILNPKRYYLVDDDDHFINHVKANGTLNYGLSNKNKWRLPDAKKAKKVYPHLRILDCATWEEIK